MRIGRFTVTAAWAPRIPRMPRFQDRTQYVCTGCGWWFTHITGDQWRGAYYAERSRPSGQYPEPGRAREMTWAQLCDSYADCCDHLVPLADPHARCPDCGVALGDYHVLGCDRAVCVRTGRQQITCPQADTHRCRTEIWSGQ